MYESEKENTLDSFEGLTTRVVIALNDLSVKRRGARQYNSNKGEPQRIIQRSLILLNPQDSSTQERLYHFIKLKSYCHEINTLFSK